MDLMIFDDIGINFLNCISLHVPSVFTGYCGMGQIIQKLQLNSGHQHI